MAGSFDNPPVIVRQSRLKTAGMMAVCGVFSLGGVWIALHPTPDHSTVWAWVAAGFFGLGFPLGLTGLLKPKTLTLGPTGMDLTLVTFRGVRTQHIAWADIDHFELIEVGRGATMVGFVYARDYVPKGKVGAALLNITHGQGGLAGSWGPSKQALVDLLNEALRRWGKAR